MAQAGFAAGRATAGMLPLAMACAAKMMPSRLRGVTMAEAWRGSFALGELQSPEQRTKWLAANSKTRRARGSLGCRVDGFALGSNTRLVTLEGRADHMEAVPLTGPFLKSVVHARSLMVCNAVSLLLTTRHTEGPLSVWTELQLQGTYAGCFARCHFAVTTCTTCPARTLAALARSSQHKEASRAVTLDAAPAAQEL